MKASTLVKGSVAGLALLVGACAERQAGELPPAASSFGAATSNNVLTQAAYLSGGVLADVSARFRAAAPDMINFDFDSAALDPEARGILDRQAAFIASNPRLQFRVYGHTDLVGSPSYNQTLGLRRAQAAVNYLVGRGVRRNQLQAVASFGETRPLIDTSNRERLNRRTVTEVIGVVGGNRTGDFDGKVADRLYEEYVGGGSAEIEDAGT